MYHEIQAGKELDEHNVSSVAAVLVAMYYFLPPIYRQKYEEQKSKMLNEEGLKIDSI